MMETLISILTMLSILVGFVEIMYRDSSRREERGSFPPESLVANLQHNHSSSVINNTINGGNQIILQNCVVNQVEETISAPQGTLLDAQLKAARKKAAIAKKEAKEAEEKAQEREHQRTLEHQRKREEIQRLNSVVHVAEKKKEKANQRAQEYDFEGFRESIGYWKNQPVGTFRSFGWISSRLSFSGDFGIGRKHKNRKPGHRTDVEILSLPRYEYEEAFNPDGLFLDLYDEHSIPRYVFPWQKDSADYIGGETQYVEFVIESLGCIRSEYRYKLLALRKAESPEEKRRRERREREEYLGYIGGWVYSPPQILDSEPSQPKEESTPVLEGCCDWNGGISHYDRVSGEELIDEDY